MATIRARSRSGGGTTYTVTWREPGGAQSSRSFRDDEDKALELKAFLDANHNSFSVATEAKRAKDSTAPTVTQWVTEHVDNLRLPPDTIADYRGYIRNHMEPHRIGSLPIDVLKRKDVIDWVDGLSATKRSNIATGKPLSFKSKKNIHALLSAALGEAVSVHKIPENVAYKVMEKGVSDKRDPVYLSPVDLDLLVKETPKEFRTFMEVLCDTGLRYNENSALRPMDVDMQDVVLANGTTERRAVIHVTRAYKRDGRIGPPKTEKSRRTVTCGRVLTASLVKAMEGVPAWDLIFKRRAGGEYVSNPWFHKNVWQPLVKRLIAEGKLARAPWIHEIRHAHTTHLLQAKVPVHVVQARLGHEDPQTTLKVYSRMAKGDDLAAIDALEAARTAQSKAVGERPKDATKGNADDALAALKALGELHGSGVLTDAEFEAKKADLLARI